MRDVKLVSLSEDGSHLVLTHEGTGEQFALAIDDRVRAAVVSDRARLGQLPLEIDSRLRPKEIQARVRAGEDSEEIAAAAGVPLERVLRYAGPVLAEREHVASLATRCAVRRRGQEGPGAILQQLVETRIRAIDGQLDTLTWDSWRGEAGQWTVAARYSADAEQHLVTFDFDAANRIVVPADDHARSLLNEPTSNENTGARTRLAAVPAPPTDSTPTGDAGQVPTGNAGAKNVNTANVNTADFDTANRGSANRGTADFGTADFGTGDTGDTGDTVDLSRLRAHVAASELAPDEVADLDDDPADAGPASGQPHADSAEQADPAEEQPTRRDSSRKRRSKRTVVPSWDEILFGAGDSGSS